MDKLSCDIKKLLEGIEILNNYEVERLVIEHLQKNLNALDELQQSYQRHYLGIIETLLKKMTMITSNQQAILQKRLVFLEKLLQKPSLTDLETLYQGIADFSQMSDAHAHTLLHDRIIGDFPPLDQGSITENPVTDKIQAIQQNNDRFVQILRDILGQIDYLNQGASMEEIRKDLESQAQLLLQKQRHLAFQLEITKQQLLKSMAKNERLDKELQCARALSLTDELTGLPNRRAFLHRMEEEIGRFRRHPTPLSLAIVDIDHFKKVNDDYGHSVGDMVLRAYAKEILASFRRHDHVARFGGEEFILLLPDTDIDGIVKALAKIRHQLNRHTLKLDKGEKPLPTFSAGVALYRANETIDDFIERADQALYQAKKKGRNKTEMAD